MTISEVDVVHASLLAADGSALLLDVREDDEWAAGHAPMAVHMPLGALEPSEVPRDRPVIAVCRSGRRSARATAVLGDAGIEVSNMVGGMQAWSAAGLSVVANDGSAGAVI